MARFIGFLGRHFLGKVWMTNGSIGANYFPGAVIMLPFTSFIRYQQLTLSAIFLLYFSIGLFTLPIYAYLVSDVTYSSFRHDGSYRLYLS